METTYRCRECGVEGAKDFFTEEGDLCNECAGKKLQADAPLPPFRLPRTPESSRGNKVLLTIYAVVGLVQIKVSMRWGGLTAAGVLSGITDAVLTFCTPILIAFSLSGIISSVTKKDPKAYFHDILFILIILSCAILFFFYSFMLGFSF